MIMVASDKKEVDDMEMLDNSFLYTNIGKISWLIQIRATQVLLQKNGEMLAIPMTSRGTDPMGHVWPYVWFHGYLLILRSVI